MDTASINRDTTVRKIVNMPVEQVLKVLILIVGMEAGEAAEGTGHQQKGEIE